MSTIFALSSGALPSAIAIFRISGNRSSRILRDLTRRERLSPRYMFHSKIFAAEGEVIDSAMAVYLPGPRTFTGEDSAEVFVHGSRAVVQAMRRRLGAMEGVRHAQPGEFTKRAYLNGKLAAAEVSALGALIHSRTERQLRQAQRALAEGDWLAERLAALRGRVALVADFGEHVDEEMEEVRKEMEALLEEVRLRRRKGVAGNRVRAGLRATLIGRPNAGKSSIFNALAGSEKAIVSAHAGTTRDCIESVLEVGGVELSITDTAGIRDTVDPVEAEGVRRSIARMEDSDIVLGIVDSRNAEEEANAIKRALPPGVEFILVRNKSDLDTRREHTVDGVSTVATREGGIQSLEEELEKRVKLLCPEDAEIGFSEGIEKVEEYLAEAAAESDVALSGEWLQAAAAAWGRANTADHVLDRIFANFCIGK